MTHESSWKSSVETKLQSPHVVNVLILSIKPQNEHINYSVKSMISLQIKIYLGPFPQFLFLCKIVY